MTLNPSKEIESSEKLVRTRKLARSNTQMEFRYVEALEIIADEATMIKTYLGVLAGTGVAGVGRG